MTAPNEAVNRHLSYSSANLLRNCEKKYEYYKIKEIPKDSDSNRDNSHFDIGTSFHYILEESMHKKPSNIGQLLEHCVQVIGLKESDAGLVHAMVLQYLRLRAKSDFEAVAVEYKIQNDFILGFVDLIEARPNGDWYISDLKTAATFYESKISELSKDRQLNLYASFKDEIAEVFNLDPEKFKGVRYLVTTKSKAKQRAKESYEEYVMRIVEGKNVKSFAITIPHELMDIEGTLKEHRELFQKSLNLRNGQAEASRNFTYCQAYFRPCEYFSQCHGMTYSEFQETNKIVVDAIR